VRGSLALLVVFASPAIARDSLGIYDGWGAFRDSAPRKCYAIGQPETGTASGAFATISWWPENAVKGQVHVRLSRSVKSADPVFLVAGGRRWRMTAGGRDAWSLSARHDAFIIARLRAAPSMVISGTAAKGGSFADRYALKGVASAMDAAALGCAKRQ
jgi:hypothetical protein